MREAEGLLALLGWDWPLFKEALPMATDETLLGVRSLLRKPPQEGEPTWIQERAEVGLKMVEAEQGRRQAV